MDHSDALCITPLVHNAVKNEIARSAYTTPVAAIVEESYANAITHCARGVKLSYWMQLQYPTHTIKMKLSLSIIMNTDASKFLCREAPFNADTAAKMLDVGRCEVHEVMGHSQHNMGNMCKDHAFGGNPITVRNYYDAVLKQGFTLVYSQQLMNTKGKGANTRQMELCQDNKVFRVGWVFDPDTDDVVAFYEELTMPPAVAQCLAHCQLAGYDPEGKFSADAALAVFSDYLKETVIAVALDPAVEGHTAFAYIVDLSLQEYARKGVAGGTDMCWKEVAGDIIYIANEDSDPLSVRSEMQKQWYLTECSSALAWRTITNEPLKPGLKDTDTCIITNGNEFHSISDHLCSEVAVLQAATSQQKLVFSKEVMVGANEHDYRSNGAPRPRHDADMQIPFVFYVFEPSVASTEACGVRMLWRNSIVPSKDPAANFLNAAQAEAVNGGYFYGLNGPKPKRCCFASFLTAALRKENVDFVVNPGGKDSGKKDVWLTKAGAAKFKAAVGVDAHTFLVNLEKHADSHAQGRSANEWRLFFYMVNPSVLIQIGNGAIDFDKSGNKNRLATLRAELVILWLIYLKTAFKLDTPLTASDHTNPDTQKLQVVWASAQSSSARAQSLSGRSGEGTCSRVAVHAVDGDAQSIETRLTPMPAPTPAASRKRKKPEPHSDGPDGAIYPDDPDVRRKRAAALIVEMCTKVLLLLDAHETAVMRDSEKLARVRKIQRRVRKVSDYSSNTPGSLIISDNNREMGADVSVTRLAYLTIAAALLGGTGTQQPDLAYLSKELIAFVIPLLRRGLVPKNIVYKKVAKGLFGITDSEEPTEQPMDEDDAQSVD